jgi:hypothetical protein
MKAFSSSKSWGILGLVAAGVAGTAVPVASGQSASNSSGEYMAHWGVGTWVSRTRGIDYQAQIDLSGTAIKRDTVLFYESWLGNFPHAGVHTIDNPAAMQAHLTKVAADVARIIPDPNFSGYAVIDYETWSPIWSRLHNAPSGAARDARDGDFKDDWKDHIRQNRPQVIAGLSGDALERAFESSYNASAQRFYLDTLRECKRLRPKAKWGFYGYPFREYYVDYLPMSSRWKDINTREMNWLFDSVDVFFPTVYSLFDTVPSSPNYSRKQNSAAENARYISENVKEAVRVSRGKPVLPFIWFRYHGNAGPNFSGKIVNDTLIRQMLEVPKQAGAQGVVIWEFLESEAQFQEFRSVLTSKVIPQMNALAVNPQAPAQRAPVVATRLPNGKVVVGKSTKPTRVANVPN